MDDEKAHTDATSAGSTVVRGAAKVPGVAGQALRRIVDLAIDGTAALPGAREAAGKQMGSKGDRNLAIDTIVVQHVGLAGTQGFVTNLGGLAAMAIGVPANFAGLTLLQSRMVACIAHLRGYDVDEPRVRSAIMMCLLGEDTATDLIRSEKLPSTPMAIATAPVFDANLDAQIAERVFTTLLAQIGGKKLSLLIGKRIPFVGGGVGAVTDGWTTHQIAQYAEKQFVARTLPNGQHA